MDEFLEETEPVKKQTNKKEKRNKQEQKHHFLAYFWWDFFQVKPPAIKLCTICASYPGLGGRFVREGSDSDGS